MTKKELNDAYEQLKENYEDVSKMEEYKYKSWQEAVKRERALEEQLQELRPLKDAIRTIISLDSTDSDEKLERITELCGGVRVAIINWED